MSADSIVFQIGMYLKQLEELPLDSKVETINIVRKMIHEISPFKEEPVDLVQWVKCDGVIGNDYNPNVVAPPEMELLRTSINNDGYTQPVVTWMNDTDNREVIDGFHRTRVCKEYDDINKRVNGYLPVVTIKDECTDKNNRIASTIRHNRARGKHKVDAMSDIVIELKNRNWKNERIARELGMDEDEVLRLCQITGLAEMFSDDEFSRSWDIENASEDGFKEYAGVDDEDIVEDVKVVTMNTGDDSRVFHTYDKWECYKAGFYATTFDGMSKKECELAYSQFLTDDEKFKNALQGVIDEWKMSCEHYLTNVALNRIAWLGQAAMCYATGVPAEFRAGYNLLTVEEQEHADLIAFEYLNVWLKRNNRPLANIDEARTSRQSVLY